MAHEAAQVLLPPPIRLKCWMWCQNSQALTEVVHGKQSRSDCHDGNSESDGGTTRFHESMWKFWISSLAVSQEPKGCRTGMDSTGDTKSAASVAVAEKSPLVTENTAPPQCSRTSQFTVQLMKWPFCRIWYIMNNSFSYFKNEQHDLYLLRKSWSSRSHRY